VPPAKRTTAQQRAADAPAKKAAPKKAAAKKSPPRKTTAKRAAAKQTSTPKVASKPPKIVVEAEDVSVAELLNEDSAIEPTRRSNAVLEVVDVSVKFGGINAVSDVTLDVLPGQITGLIGPNGAGKTTTFNMITGLQEPTRGRVFINGKDVGKLAPHKRARLGLARTFQRLEVFGSLTVYENILAAAEFHKSWSDDKTPPRQVTAEIVERVGLTRVANARVDALPTGMARLVELGRALATRPQVLLLDEVGSGLSGDETDALGDLMLDLVRDGTAILLVEHDVELVMRVCAHIFVLDFGRIIASGTPEQIQQDPVVQAAYLGSDEMAS
jgi:branched-chain amino acid transport system ATP-binding protein